METQDLIEEAVPHNGIDAPFGIVDSRGVQEAVKSARIDPQSYNGAANGRASGSTKGSRRDDKGPKQLSLISKKFDVDGDGELDEAELAMRNLDQTGRGYLTNEKVYNVMQDHIKTQRDLFRFKKIVISLVAFTVLLTLCNLGTSIAAAYLAKDTTTNEKDELVSSANKKALGTQTTSESYAIQRKDGEYGGRKLCTTQTDGTVQCTTTSYISMEAAKAQAMICSCYLGKTVNLIRTWSIGTTTPIPICPLDNGVTGEYSGDCSNSCTVCSSVTFSNGISIGPNMDTNDGSYKIDGDAFTRDLGLTCDLDADCDDTLVCQSNKCAAVNQCPTENVINNPEEFAWTYHPASGTNPEPYYSGVMEVGEETFTINGETLTTRAYRQKNGSYSIPGPTLRMVPGNKYVLKLHNLLPYEEKSAQMNVYKDPNVVNIHTHGLHISGESPGDDVTRAFEGQHGGDYVYDIPSDHMGGTYWYHAHHHGATYLQVSGGLFGMIIVDDSADGIPSTVSSMVEQQLVIGYIDVTAAGTGGDVLLGGTLSSTWTVNGLVGGSICMPPNTWQRWRVLTAHQYATMRTIEFGGECEIMVLARDGVWRFEAPKILLDSKGNRLNSLEMTGASRTDFAVRCGGDSKLMFDGTDVATISTDGGVEDASVSPYDTDGVSTWSAIRPSYLRDLRGETNVNSFALNMGARSIENAKFDHEVPNFSLSADQVQEWSITGSGQHPFHLHVYHVQALDSANGFEAGEYYDTTSGISPVRFDLNEATTTVYQGRTIIHCHILEHEDQGAMGWFDVTSGQGAPTFPNDSSSSFSEYYSIETGTSVAPTGTGGTNIHIDSIVVERTALTGNRFMASATVAIKDGSGSIVSGATVSGIFTGPTSDASSVASDANGVAIHDSSITKTTGDWCFEVTRVELDGATYDNAANNVSKMCENSGA